MTRLRRRCSLLLLLCLMCGAGCHILHLTPLGRERFDRDVTAGLPGKHSFRVSQFLFLADFEVKRTLPIFKELADLRDQVHKELQLPSSNAIIQVYLFEDKERYEQFMQTKYPDLPKRRAFFVAQPRRLGSLAGSEDLLVYTYWGERIRQDLRHELTHALLHSVLKEVPLWLDEGLAEYFEMPPGWNGVNYQHIEQLRRGPGQLDLTRLEQLSEVQQMTPAEYREAWAWVHLMLRSTPQAKQVLIGYLQELRTSTRPGSLRSRLTSTVPSLDTAMERHLADLDAKRSRSPAAQR